MQLTRKGIAVMLLGMVLAGGIGAVGAVHVIGEYNRYQALLATADALVALAKQNIKAGKLDPLPALDPGVPGK